MKTIIAPIVALIFLALQTVFHVDVKIPQEDVINAVLIVVSFAGVIINHFKKKE